MSLVEITVYRTLSAPVSDHEVEPLRFSTHLISLVSFRTSNYRLPTGSFSFRHPVSHAQSKSVSLSVRISVSISVRACACVCVSALHSALYRPSPRQQVAMCGHRSDHSCGAAGSWCRSRGCCQASWRSGPACGHRGVRGEWARGVNRVVCLNPVELKL